MAEIQTPAAARHDLASAERPAGSTGPPGDARAANGDIVVSQAWSGDIFRADLNSRYCTLKLPIPAVGAMFGTDNRCIPLHGQNPAAPYGSKTSSTSRRSGPWWRTTTTTSCPVPAAQDVVLHLCRLGRPQRGGIAQ